jgi:hypothetical protein
MKILSFAPVDEDTELRPADYLRFSLFADHAHGLFLKQPMYEPK